MPVETLHVRLTGEQRKAVEAALETTHDVRVYKRLKVVELSSRGYTVRALAALFNVCQQSIRHYLHAYQRGGLEARHCHINRLARRRERAVGLRGAAAVAAL